MGRSNDKPASIDGVIPQQMHVGLATIGPLGVSNRTVPRKLTQSQVQDQKANAPGL
jgi:hypothetical protein